MVWRRRRHPDGHRRDGTKRGFDPTPSTPQRSLTAATPKAGPVCARSTVRTFMRPTSAIRTATNSLGSVADSLRARCNLGGSLPGTLPVGG